MRPPLHPGTHAKLLEHRHQRLPTVPQRTREYDVVPTVDSIPSAWCFYGFIIFGIALLGTLGYFFIVRVI